MAFLKSLSVRLKYKHGDQTALERLASMFFVVGKGCLKKFLWNFYFVVSIFVYSFASINFIILNVIWKNEP